jgi:hypothetical protein
VSMPRATPNMIKPKQKLSSTRLSSEKVIWMDSRDAEVVSNKEGLCKESRNKKTASASWKRFRESITNQSKTTIKDRTTLAAVDTSLYQRANQNLAVFLERNTRQIYG